MYLTVLGAVAAESTSEQVEFFEKQVRPILVERCYKCHSTQSEKLKGGLLLDSREGVLKGGEDGPVISLEFPEKSKLIEAINYQNPDLQMPPKGKLPDQQISALTEWIKMGAPWPLEAGKSTSTTATFDLEKRRREHWAWQPIKPQPLPSVKTKAWPSSAPDHFILARLEQGNLHPAIPADGRILIRRVYFDLLGLPPRREEVDAFLADTSSNAYEKVVDRLLASPHFGERWARHWLDLVRYAETLGHEFDYPVQNAWRYRDYVIRAFNADVPYNQFVVEHIAGDLLPNPRKNPVQKFNESVIGTGFFWFGQRDHSPVDVRQHQAELIDNQIDVMCKTFLGLTVSCARCHDHKFDAIATKDFYALYGVLESSRYAQKAIDPSPIVIINRLKQLKKDIRETACSEWSKQSGQISNYLCAVKEAAPNDASYAWHKLSAADPKSSQALRLEWNSLLREANSNSSEPDTNYEYFAQATGGSFKGWFADGDAFTLGAGGSGDFIAGVTGLKLLHQTTINDAVLSSKLEGSLRSPGFEIKYPYVWILACGRNSRIRICVDNLTMIRDPIYGGLAKHLDRDELKWLRFDLRMWQGHRAYIEFSDTSTSDPTEESKGDDTGWLSASEVAFSNQTNSPAQKRSPDWLELLGSDPPDSLAALELRYENAFKDALRLWKSDLPHDSIRDQAHLALLDELIQKQFLTTKSAFSSQDRFGALLKEYDQIAASLPRANRVPAMTDGEGFDEHVFIRGNHKSLGDLAPREFLTALRTGRDAPFKMGSGRLELAQRITDSANPLFARVMVNRIWLHLFGHGIVPTPDDFGKLGQPPSHPELLDWLANWYRTEAHWSTKKLVRLLVTSSTYRMSSRAAVAEDEEKDPDNVLLHRMPIRRLEGESIRDAMIAISGRMDEKMFGPSVPTHLTEFMEGRGRPGSSGPLDGEGRRSIYLEVRRNFLSPMMRTFDTPVPFTTIGKRTVSNVPAQSLILLNDPFVLSQARLWALRLLAEKNCSSKQRIQRMYAAAFGRMPNAEEEKCALEFLQHQGKDYGGSGETAWSLDERVWTDLCHVAFNLKEFIFVE